MSQPMSPHIAGSPTGSGCHCCQAPEPPALPLLQDLIKRHSEFISYPISLWTEKTTEKEVTDDEEEIEEGEDEGETHPPVVAESTRTLQRHSVSEAVTALDLTGAPVIVFVHAGTGRINVVYRRSDGAIGWVDPPEAA